MYVLGRHMYIAVRAVAPFESANGCASVKGTWDPLHDEYRLYLSVPIISHQWYVHPLLTVTWLQVTSRGTSNLTILLFSLPRRVHHPNIWELRRGRATGKHLLLEKQCLAFECLKKKKRKTWSAVLCCAVGRWVVCGSLGSCDYLAEGLAGWDGTPLP